MDEIKHYIRTDQAGIIIRGFSSAFEQPQEGDICVEESGGRHYSPVLTNAQRQYIFKWNGTAIVERSQQELADELAARPPAPETDADKIARLEAEKAAQAAQIADINRNFTDFVDFYFVNNPTQA